MSVCIKEKVLYVSVCMMLQPNEALMNLCEW